MSVHQFHPLPHALKAEPLSPQRGTDVEAFANVRHTKVNFSRCSPQSHVEALDPAVLRRIVQCFLQNSKEVERDLRRQTTRHVMVFKQDFEIPLLAEFITPAPNGLTQSQKLQG